jgi:hypothetical protein
VEGAVDFEFIEHICVMRMTMIGCHNPHTYFKIDDRLNPPGAIELFVILPRECVESITRITEKIPVFRRVAVNKDVKMTTCESRADRMHTWPTILADGSQEGIGNLILIEQALADHCEIGTHSGKFTPSDHQYTSRGSYFRDGVHRFAIR